MSDDMVERAEMNRVLAGRDKAKDRARKAEADLAEANKKLVAVQARGDKGTVDAGDLPEAQVRDALLSAAVMEAGAEHASQLVTLLRGRVRLDKLASGQFALSMQDSEGRLITGLDGTPQTDLIPAIRQFLAKPENLNLVRHDSKKELEQEAARQKVIQEHIENPPASMGELSALPPDVRGEILDSLSPAQRAELANPTEHTIL